MPSDTSNDLDQEIGALLLQVMETMKAGVLAASAARDLGPAHVMLLHSLREPHRMGELAGDLGYDASHITALVDRLEHLGLVERRADPADRRARVIVITAKGRRTHAAIEREIFSQLPALANLTVDERESLRALLAKAVCLPA